MHPLLRFLCPALPRASFLWCAEVGCCLYHGKQKPLLGLHPLSPPPLFPEELSKSIVFSYCPTSSPWFSPPPLQAGSPQHPLRLFWTRSPATSCIKSNGHFFVIIFPELPGHSVLMTTHSFRDTSFSSLCSHPHGPLWLPALLCLLLLMAQPAMPKRPCWILRLQSFSSVSQPWAFLRKPPPREY